MRSTRRTGIQISELHSLFKSQIHLGFSSSGVSGETVVVPNLFPRRLPGEENFATWIREGLGSIVRDIRRRLVPNHGGVKISSRAGVILR